MKLTTGQIAGFLEKPPAAVRIILIYGQDAGLVSERAAGLAKKITPDPDDPFSVTLLTGSAVAEREGRLFDEMSASAFGGGRRLVRLQQTLESNGGAVAKLLADLPVGDSALLIEAGDLDKKSKLRAACETESPFVCAVPCYVEDSSARQRTVSDIFKSFNLRIDPSLLSSLVDQLPPDRLAMRSEIEKICLYCNGQTEVTSEDLLAVLADAGGAELDELALRAASGEPREAMRLLDRLLSEQTSPIALLRTLQRHFMKIKKARSFFDGGLSAKAAVEKLQPKVFWKAVPAMTKQVQNWPQKKTEKVLEALFEAEAVCKRTGTPDVALVSQLILRIENPNLFLNNQV